MDVLGEVLLTTRLLASTINILDLAAPWGLAVPSERSNLALGMIVLDGRCWFVSDSWPLTEMHPGDCMLTLRGSGHRCMSAPGVEMTSFFDFRSAHGIPPLTVDQPHEPPLVTRVGTGDKRTRLLVFGLIAQDAGPSSILANLPPTLLINAGTGQLSPCAAAAAHFLVEDNRSRPGHLSIATKLTELLFTNVVREYVLSEPGIDAGWMRGLRDAPIGRAVTCIHKSPGAPWTVERLAREAGMSRAAFARRFTKLLGATPIDYLINHRMELAGVRLATEGQPVAAVAEGLGYRSERAFRQAFRNRFGVAPSRYVRMPH